MSLDMINITAAKAATVSTAGPAIENLHTAFDSFKQQVIPKVEQMVVEGGKTLSQQAEYAVSAIKNIKLSDVENVIQTTIPAGIKSIVDKLPGH
ncbi:MAG: hypothetical protein JO089_01835 [Alphaproteobacteria bacterium]|nr:hypothetical protein [Alphaproteobacteria bacterium]